jgi:hypothetical protein
MSAVSARTSSINACIPTTVLWFAQRSKRPLKIDMVTMLRRMIGEDIELATTLAAGLTQVRADRSQLEQVVMNLVINARDACGPGGKIRLVTEAADIDGPIAGLTPGLNRGAYVALSVIDNGTGLNEATKSRLFEPSSRPSHAGGAQVLDSPRSTASWFRAVGRFRSRASSGEDRDSLFSCLVRMKRRR